MSTIRCGGVPDFCRYCRVRRIHVCPKCSKIPNREMGDWWYCRIGVWVIPHYHKCPFHTTLNVRTVHRHTVIDGTDIEGSAE